MDNPKQDYIFCPNCGKKISKSDNFCPFCNYQLNGQNTQQQTQAQPQQQAQINNTQATQQRPSYNYTPTRDAMGYTPRNNGGYQPQQSYGLVQKRRITPPSCSFIQAFKLFWVNYVNFGGYSSRSEFWWWFLIEYIVDFIFLIFSWGSIAASIDNGDVGAASLISDYGIAAIWYLAIIIPNIALRARRFRDAGVSTGWIVAILIMNYSAIIPILGWIVSPISRIASFVIELLPSERKVISNQPMAQPQPQPQAQQGYQAQPQQPQQPQQPNNPNPRQ